MTQASNETATRPAPVAPRRPHSFTAHGITVHDDYAWLKDENWQDVLRDPSILNADIRSYLEAENAYTDSLLGHTAGLQKTLVAEMRGRIKEDDFSVPAPDGPFAYFRKFRDGGQHELFGRMPRDGGKTEIILDGEQLAADHDYFKFGDARHSPDHRLEAWSADIKGSEYFSVRVRDWADGKDLDDLVEETDGAVVWSADFAPSSTSGSTTTTARCRSGATASARRRRTTCSSTRSRTPAGSPISMRAPAAVSA